MVTPGAPDTVQPPTTSLMDVFSGFPPTPVNAGANLAAPVTVVQVIEAWVTSVAGEAADAMLAVEAINPTGSATDAAANISFFIQDTISCSNRAPCPGTGGATQRSPTSRTCGSRNPLQRRTAPLQLS